MKIVIRKLRVFAFTTVFISALSSAATRGLSSDVTTGGSGLLNYSNSVSGLLGFHKSQLVFGAEYERHTESLFAFGALFRFRPKSTSDQVPGLWTLAAFLRPHFRSQYCDFYAGPALGVLSWNSKSISSTSGNANEDETTLAPMLNVGVTFRITPQFTAGFDYTSYFGWFGNDFEHDQDLLAKLTFGF